MPDVLVASFLVPFGNVLSASDDLDVAHLVALGVVLPIQLQAELGPPLVVHVLLLVNNLRELLKGQ